MYISLIFVTIVCFLSINTFYIHADPVVNSTYHQCRCQNCTADVTCQSDNTVQWIGFRAFGFGWLEPNRNCSSEPDSSFVLRPEFDNCTRNFTTFGSILGRLSGEITLGTLHKFNIFDECRASPDYFIAQFVCVPLNDPQKGLKIDSACQNYTTTSQSLSIYNRDFPRRIDNTGIRSCYCTVRINASRLVLQTYDNRLSLNQTLALTQPNGTIIKQWKKPTSIAEMLSNDIIAVPNDELLLHWENEARTWMPRGGKLWVVIEALNPNESITTVCSQNISTSSSTVTTSATREITASSAISGNSASATTRSNATGGITASSAVSGNSASATTRSNATGGITASSVVSGNSASVTTRSNATGGITASSAVSGNSASATTRSNATGGITASSAVSGNSASATTRSNATGGITASSVVSGNSASVTTRSNATGGITASLAVFGNSASARDTTTPSMSNTSRVASSSTAGLRSSPATKNASFSTQTVHTLTGINVSPSSSSYLNSSTDLNKSLKASSTHAPNYTSITEPKTDSVDGKKNLGAVIGGVIGGLFFLILLILLCVICCIKKKKRTVEPSQQPSNSRFQNERNTKDNLHDDGAFENKNPSGAKIASDSSRMLPPLPTGRLVDNVQIESGLPDFNSSTYTDVRTNGQASDAGKDFMINDALYAKLIGNTDENTYTGVEKSQIKGQPVSDINDYGNNMHAAPVIHTDQGEVNDDGKKKKKKKKKRRKRNTIEALLDEEVMPDMDKGQHNQQSLPVYD